MITEDYVSFETAKLLREKGFKEPTLAYAYGQDMVDYYSQPKVTDDYNVEAGRYPLPTLQMACKWLKEAHKIYIDISPTYSEVEKTIHFIWQIFDSNYDVVGDCKIFYSEPETACEAAIKYCLEHLI